MGTHFFESKFGIGDKVADKVTKFEGVILAVSFYFSGCHHYGLQRQKTTKDGVIDENYTWVDESRLTLVKAKEVSFILDKPTSGPHPNAPTM